MPADVLTDLASIHKALNACDPFYRYDYAVSGDLPPDEPSPSDVGLVAVCGMRQDSVWITIRIFARSLAALEESRISMQFKLAIPENDDELRQQVQKFIDYGAPFPCRRARSAARSICQPAWAATLAEEPSMWRR